MHHTQAHVLAVLGRVQQGARLRGTHAPGRSGQVARRASRIATVRLLQATLRRVADAQCSEISFLLGVKSKYIPGGEFEPDWKGPVGAPGMPPTGPPPDAGPPPPPPPDAKEDPRAARGARVSYHDMDEVAEVSLPLSRAED